MWPTKPFTTIKFQPKANGNRAGTKRKRVMKFSDDDDDETETKSESGTKIEDEGICLDDEGCQPAPNQLLLFMLMIINVNFCRHHPLKYYFPDLWQIKLDDTYKTDNDSHLTFEINHRYSLS